MMIYERVCCRCGANAGGLGYRTTTRGGSRCIVLAGVNRPKRRVRCKICAEDYLAFLKRSDQVERKAIK